MATTMRENIRALVRPCPLCGCGTGRIAGDLHFEVFDDSPVSGVFALAACEECGFIFYDTSSGQSDYDRYYRQNAYYFTATTAGTGGSGPLEERRFEAQIRRLAPHIQSRDAAIFDVGCGKGGWLEAAARQGYTNLYGVDMVPACVEHVGKKCGIAAGIGSAVDLPFPDVRADVLIYSHVVEHVVDLRALLSAAREKLNDGGLLYAEVPDASLYREYADRPYRYLFLEHVNHLDGPNLVNLFRSGGFSPVETGSFLMEGEAGGRFPCVWGVFRKGEEVIRKTNGDLGRCLKQYLHWSETHPALKILDRPAEERTPLFVWGISQYAMLLLGLTALGRCNLRGFLDKDPYKQTRTLLGRPIQPPEVLRGVGPGHAVLVTAPGYEEQIKSALREMGFRGSVWTMLEVNSCCVSLDTK